MECRMKIAYLTASSDVSGGQRVIFQQAEALAALGCDITLVCPEPKPTWFPIQKPAWETTAFGGSRALADADIRVATYWTTVAPALEAATGPVFHLCQGYEPDFSFNVPHKREIEQAYAQPTRKLTVSPQLTRRLTAAGYAPVTYVGQAFNPEEFPPERDRRFDKTAPVVLVTGIFEADVKGIPETLQALAALRGSGISFRLYRVSTQPISPAEKAILVPDQYLVRLSPSEMGAIYRAADLLIGPSHPEEGFGLPVLEALSSGLPVLLSDTPGHRHIARTAAQYFPVSDVAAMAKSIAELFSDRHCLATLSAMGPNEAARFHTRNVANRLLMAFQKALLNPGVGLDPPLNHLPG